MKYLVESVYPLYKLTVYIWFGIIYFIYFYYLYLPWFHNLFYFLNMFVQDVFNTKLYSHFTNQFSFKTTVKHDWQGQPTWRYWQRIYLKTLTHILFIIIFGNDGVHLINALIIHFKFMCNMSFIENC